LYVRGTELEKASDVRLLLLLALAACGDVETSKNTVRRGLEPSVTSAEIVHATLYEDAVERVAAPPPLRATAVMRPESTSMFGSEQSGSIPQEMAGPACVPRWSMRSLDQCLDGDGDGCAGIGDDYETNACDAFSSIKWYRRGCRLGSALACTALVRLHEPVPPPEI
jgi:hypothetical protein